MSKRLAKIFVTEILLAVSIASISLAIGWNSIETVRLAAFSLIGIRALVGLLRIIPMDVRTVAVSDAA